MHPFPDPETLIRFLATIPLFSKADRDLLTYLSGHVRMTRVPPGTTLIRKGELGDTMYVIYSGTLRVHDGEHDVARLGDGQFFGELSLLDSEPRSMSVSAVSESLVCSIERNDFYAVLEQFPAVTRDIIAVLNRRLRNQNQVLINEFRTREGQLTELVRIRTAEVMRQSKIIEEKNKEMLDSLHYAKRLQAAILPSPGAIGNVFPDSFVLFRPKDIVSGDFYALEAIDGLSLLAAADCTGHGVSGAIMSMIGSSLLKQIINEKRITDPAGILHALNDGVIEALKQAENDTHDGMDIALCAFDLPRGQALFAGANRPLWRIRNGELETIPSDKLPIGGLQIDRSRPFANRTIELRPGDAIYLFSDGYADQFGGAEGKKLMTKRLKELLLSFGSLPMQEQHGRLRDFLDAWMGSLEQTDDILVIGLRI